MVMGILVKCIPFVGVVAMASKSSEGRKPTVSNSKSTQEVHTPLYDRLPPSRSLSCAPRAATSNLSALLFYFLKRDP